MHDEMDPEIQRLFEEHSRRLAEEPFLSNTLNCLRRRQTQRDLLHKVLLVLGLACCVLLSPFFVKGSVLLSEYVGRGLGYLESPIAFVIGGVLLIILARRKLIFVLARL